MSAHINSISDGGDTTKVHNQICEEHAQVERKLIMKFNGASIILPNQIAEEHLY
jgi:hypothetical protein